MNTIEKKTKIIEQCEETFVDLGAHRRRSKRQIQCSLIFIRNSPLFLIDVLIGISFGFQ